jgi:hypothetical protein
MECALGLQPHNQPISSSPMAIPLMIVPKNSSEEKAAETIEEPEEDAMAGMSSKKRKRFQKFLVTKICIVALELQMFTSIHYRISKRNEKRGLY